MSLFVNACAWRSLPVLSTVFLLVLTPLLFGNLISSALDKSFAPTAPEQPAHEKSCKAQATLRSQESKTPVKLRFINESGATLILQWIGYNGALKEYATLPPGADVTQDTFMTHPWIVAYQEGSCRQIFLPASGVSIARLRPESELQKKAQDCGANASRNPQGDCSCNKNYQMQNGACVVPKQRAADCSRDEVYSSSMGQCIPKSLGR